MKSNINHLGPGPVTLETLALILLDIMAQLQSLPTQDEQYYDNADVKRMLNMSDSTLHRIRKAKRIPFRKIGGKIYYPKAFFNKAFNF